MAKDIILISDTHYGVKQNSVTWLNYQLDFIDQQLIPFIEESGKRWTIYHLGDMMDSRSSISPYTASRVTSAYVRLARVCDDIVVIGGNHDYYSPEESEDHNINSLEMVFGKVEINEPNFHLITQKMIRQDDDLFVPWFEWSKIEEIADYVQQGVKRIFAHTDLININKDYLEVLKDVQVYSGHIHTPCLNGNLITLGSTYPLTFADANQERGFYTLTDELVFHPNNVSIKFYRLKNDEIFSIEKIRPFDYIELYVDQLLLMQADYIDQIKAISEKVKNCSIIPIVKKSDEDDKDVELYNIEEACKSYIPEELLPKFKQVVDRLEEKRQNP